MTQQVIPNPYNISHPIEDSRAFFGREDIFEWLAGHLEQSTQPIILYGSPQIGKSSILKEIERSRFHEQFTPIYIDLQQIALDSLSIFLWELANITTNTLAAAEMETPSLQQTIFIADPFAALSQLLTTANNHFQNRPLLFLFDNLQTLYQQIQKEQLPSNTFEQLQQQFTTHNTYTIFTLTQEPFGNIHNFFSNTHQRLIPPLSKEASTNLIRYPTTYTVFQDVAHYIYQLTNGHPHDIQHICHALHEHQQKNKLNHITVADVVLIKTHALKQEQLKSTSSTRLPSYKLEAQKRNRGQRARGSVRNLLLLLLLFVLIGSALLLVGRSGNATPLAFLNRATPTPRIVRVERVTPTTDPAAAAIADAEPTATTTVAPTAVLPTDTPAPTDTPTTEPTAVLPTDTPIPTDTPAPSLLDPAPIITRTQDNMPMILIPADTFTMGSEEDNIRAGVDEKPQRQVTLDAFYIDKYEVSVAQYAAFLTRQGDYRLTCDNISCALPRELAGTTSFLLEQDEGDGTLQYTALVGFANYPINHVSWFGANSYCQSVGGRLPTEAEWEYAARGTDSRIYPWGDLGPTPQLAVFASENYDNIKAVDALPDGVSPFGLHHMAGSMWEWVADWYAEDYYSEAPNENPQGPTTSLTRVIRGGGWPNNNQADRLRVANRNNSLPEFYSAAIGFRCARSLSP